MSGMMAHAYNTVLWEVKAEGLGTSIRHSRSRPVWLHTTLSQTNMDYFKVKLIETTRFRADEYNT